jgi:hypothetical protein
MFKKLLIALSLLVFFSLVFSQWYYVSTYNLKKKSFEERFGPRFNPMRIQRGIYPINEHWYTHELKERRSSWFTTSKNKDWKKQIWIGPLVEKKKANHFRKVVERDKKLLIVHETDWFSWKEVNQSEIVLEIRKSYVGVKEEYHRLKVEGEEMIQLKPHQSDSILLAWGFELPQEMEVTMVRGKKNMVMSNFKNYARKGLAKIKKAIRTN